MEYSNQIVVSDGTLQLVSLTFPYIDKVDVHVSVDFGDGPEEYAPGTIWDWVGSEAIRFDEPLPDGAVAQLQRQTEIGDILNKFTLGAMFNAPTLDENFDQLLYIAQEYSDVREAAGKSLRVPSTEAPVAALPGRSERAGKLVAFDSAGEPEVRQDVRDWAVRASPEDAQLVELPPAEDRANKVLTFDADGQPTAAFPAADSAAELRMDLANPDMGAATVARGTVAVEGVADLLALQPGQREEGLRYLVKGYHAPLNFLAKPYIGGGEFYWDATSTDAGNGGTVLEVPDVNPGRFIRVSGDVVTPYSFGAVDSTTEDSYTQIMGFLADAAARPRGQYSYELRGTFASSDTLVLDGFAGKVMPMDCRIQMLANVPVMFVFRNCGSSGFPGRLSVLGRGGSNLAANGCIDGIHIDGCPRTQFGSFFTTMGRGWGLRELGGSSNMMSIEFIEASNFGSTAGSTRNQNITALAYENNGQSGQSVNQLTLITLEDPEAFPVVSDSYVVVDGELFAVQGMNRETGVLSVYPFVPTSKQIPGSVHKLVYGGGAKLGRQSGAKFSVGAIISTRCGIGALIEGGSVPNVGRLVSQFNGVALALGGLRDQTFSGTDISSVYFEGEIVAEVVFNSTAPAFSNGTTLTCMTGVDLTKWHSLQPRYTWGGQTPLRYFPVEIRAGNRLWPVASFRGVATGNTTDSAAYSLRSDGNPIHIQGFRGNISLNLVHDLDFDRLKGVRPSEALVTGGGPNKNYTGTLYINAGAGYTVNGLVAPLRLKAYANPFRVTAWLTSDTNWQVTVEELPPPELFAG